MRTWQAPDYKHTCAGRRGGNSANQYQRLSARIVARASLVTKAKRKSAAPIPANGLRDLPATQMDVPVSEPSFPIGIGRRQRVNAKLPAADTNRSRESGLSFRMQPGKEFIIA